MKNKVDWYRFINIWLPMLSIIFLFVGGLFQFFFDFHYITAFGFIMFIISITITDI